MSLPQPFSRDQLEYLRRIFPDAELPEPSETPEPTPAAVPFDPTSTSTSTPTTGAPTASVPGTHAISTLPLFSPSTPGSSGLDLLAAAASATSPTGTPASLGESAGGSSMPNLVSKGPFNPAASLPTKVVRRILDLEFVEMAELTIEDDPLPGTSRLPTPARPPIRNISQWIERYSLMAALLAMRFPDKAPELFAYQATIVRAERNYEEARWTSYDRSYRRQALARKDLNWSVPDARLYSEAFTGRARAIARCTWCLEDDHSEAACPKNPHRPIFGFFPDPSTWLNQVTPPATWHSPPAPPSYGPAQEICRRYNEGKCSKPRCKRRHACLSCYGAHRQMDCPRMRPRSPLQLGSHPPPPPSGLRGRQ